MKRRAGFTLVEVIASLTVMAIIMYASIAIFINAGFKGVNVDVYTTAQSLAERRLEEIMSRDFAGISAEVETNFSGDFSRYSSQVLVSYVASDALDVPVVNITQYRKIAVIIRHSQLAGGLSLEAIRANY
ncbi:prepilin-type N-terminal cleavage/methylation domain-containing protein [Candidatus Saganbacteria bacterium]|nr:prepilin-type N-terminal cleavage/methylation domain-containing protein [Candidatus Saganbacteria bacterium]